MRRVHTCKTISTMSNQTHLSLSFRRGFLIFHVPSKRVDFRALKICHPECAMKMKSENMNNGEKLFLTEFQWFLSCDLVYLECLAHFFKCGTIQRPHKAIGETSGLRKMLKKQKGTWLGQEPYPCDNGEIISGLLPREGFLEQPASNRTRARRYEP